MVNKNDNTINNQNNKLKDLYQQAKEVEERLTSLSKNQKYLLKKHERLCKEIIREEKKRG